MGLSSTFNNHAGGSDRRDDSRDNHDRGYGGTLAGSGGRDTPPLDAGPATTGASASTPKPQAIEPIVLPTQFSGIPEKERDKRIDALRKLIDQKLVEMTGQLALAQGSPGAISQWYTDNTIARVYKNVAEGTPQSQADIDKELPSALSSYAALDRIQTRYGDRMSHKEFFDGLISTRPEYTLLGSLSGKLANEQEGFLRELKQAGEKVLTLAATQVAKAQQALKAMKEESWQNFSGLQDFYATVTTEIMERNPDGVLAAVHNAMTQGVSARDVRVLLEKPVRGHASVIDALSAFSLSPREEMEIAARIMIALDDDFEAVNFINNTIQTLKDPARRKNYQGYADAFVGNYVPTGSHSVFNADAIMDARHEDGSLMLDIPSKSGAVQWQASRISKEDADSLLRQLFRRRNFSTITETTGFNTDNIISIAYEPMSGALKWQSRGGPDGKEAHFRLVDRKVALHALSAITDKPGFMLLPEGTVLNTRHVRSIGYDANRGELTWKTSGGNAGYADNRLPMTQADAVKVLVNFARRPDMTMLSLTDFVSTKSIHSVEYDEEQGSITCLLRGGPNGYYEWFNGPAEKKAAQELIEKLGGSGKFHRFNSHSLLNTDIVQSVTYDKNEQRLVYRLAGGRTGAHELWVDQSTPQQARAAFSAFADNPGFGEYVQPNKDAILNVRSIQSMEFLRDSGTLTYCLAGGKGGCTDLETRSDELTAKEIMEKLSDSGKYIEIKPYNIIEKAAILSAWHEPRKFNYQMAGGEHGHVDWQIQMSMTDTARIQKALTKDPDLHMLGDRLVRLSKMVHAEYNAESEEMVWTMVGSKEGTFTDREKVSAQEAGKLLRALRVYGQRDYLARNFKIAPEDLDITIANARAADKKSAAEDAGIGSLVEYVPWVVFASSSFISDPEAGLSNMKIDIPQSELNEIAGRKNPLFDLIPKKRKDVSSENDFSSLLDMIDGTSDFDDGDAGPTLTENNDSNNEIVALPGPGHTLTPELQIFINEEAMDAFWGTDKAFEQFEAAKAAAFLDALKSNGAVQDAAARWTTLGDTEKLAVLDNIARIQASIYGFDAVPVIPMLEEPQGALLVNARFNRALDEKGCIEINVHPKSTLKDFARAVASIVHENTHNWQHQLAAAVAEGTLQKGDPLYRQARDFQLALATQANVQHSFGQYLAESTERHARKAAGTFHAALTAQLDSLKPAGHPAPALLPAADVKKR